MHRYVAYIDESGAKQNAATMVANADAFGVAVGILLPAELEGDFVETLGEKLTELPDENTHVTDLNGSQEVFRQAVFEAIREMPDVRVVFEAIFALGYHHAEYELMLPSYNEFKERQKGSRIKHSVRLENPSAHAELLTGVVLKASAFAVDLCGSADVEVACKVDEVDDSILEEVRKSLKEYSENHWVRQEKGFDIETRKLVFGSIETSINTDMIVNIGRWELKKLSKKDVGIFAADIVANALHFHINEYITRHGHSRLNCQSAIEGFALEKSIKVCERDFSDICYNNVPIRK